MMPAAPTSVSNVPGTISIPHGWGHDDPGAQLPVAAQRPGVNANILADPQQIDALTGSSVVNGIPVTVTRA